MRQPIRLSVKGAECGVAGEPATPLLYVLRNDLQLKGTRFGCGSGACGSCTVHVDGRAVQSCNTPLRSVEGHAVTTIEGLGRPEAPHPVQQAFIDEQAAQCAYCITGIMMSIAALLGRTPAPTDAELLEALNGHLCRCGAHLRILRAARRAATLMGTKR
jgi:nicotinate dehydrogenase subunit A